MTHIPSNVAIPGTSRPGGAPPHPPLTEALVHVFVDDQNLRVGLAHDDRFGPAFRVDYGKLLGEAARDSAGNSRSVGTAFIAGVIPDDDEFWREVQKQGFTVKRGFIGEDGHSKQDDAHIVAAITAAVCERGEPSTVVLVSGDADYGPALERAVAKGWRVEVAFPFPWGISPALVPVTHEFRRLDPRRFREEKINT